MLLTEQQTILLFDIAKGCLYSEQQQFAGYSKEEIMILLNDIISQQDNKLLIPCIEFNIEQTTEPIVEKTEELENNTVEVVENTEPKESVNKVIEEIEENIAKKKVKKMRKVRELDVVKPDDKYDILTDPEFTIDEPAVTVIEKEEELSDFMEILDAELEDKKTEVEEEEYTEEVVTEDYIEEIVEEQFENNIVEEDSEELFVVQETVDIKEEIKEPESVETSSSSDDDFWN